MNRFTALFVCAAVALATNPIAKAAPVVDHTETFPAVPLQTFTQTFWLSAPSILTGHAEAYSNFGTLPYSAFLLGPDGTQYDFTPTLTSRSLSTLDLGPVRADPGDWTAVFAGGVDTDRWSIEVTATPAPEPASWALMIVGFLGVGAAMRRRVVLGEVV